MTERQRKKEYKKFAKIMYRKKHHINKDDLYTMYFILIFTVYILAQIINLIIGG